MLLMLTRTLPCLPLHPLLKMVVVLLIWRMLHFLVPEHQFPHQNLSCLWLLVKRVHFQHVLQVPLKDSVYPQWMRLATTSLMSHHPLDLKRVLCLLIDPLYTAGELSSDHVCSAQLLKFSSSLLTFQGKKNLAVTQLFNEIFQWFLGASQPAAKFLWDGMPSWIWTDQHAHPITFRRWVIFFCICFFTKTDRTFFLK